MHNLKRTHLSAVLALSLVVIPVMPAYAQGPQWSAEPLLRVGEAQGVEFGAVGDIAVAPDGGFYVLDRMESRVLAFGADGTLRHSFGTRGGGPGELSRAPGGILLLDGQLVIPDMGNRRINLFEVDGTFVRSRPVNSMHGFPMAWVVTASGIASLVRPLPIPGAAQYGGITQTTVFAIDPRTDAEPDTLFRVALAGDEGLARRGSFRSLDVGAAQLMMAGDGGRRILLAQSDTYRIRIMAPDGATAGWITHDAPRYRYTREEMAELRTSTEAMLGRAMAEGAAAGAAMRGGNAQSVELPQIDVEVPEHAPAIETMLGGDAFLIVRPGGPPDVTPPWHVLAYDGRFLGSLMMPDRFRPYVIAGGLMYGVERDEYDVDTVAIYRIKAPR